MKNNNKLPEKWYICGCKELKEYLIENSNNYNCCQGSYIDNGYLIEDEIWNFHHVDYLIYNGYQEISLQQYLESLETNKNNTTMQTIEIPEGFQLNLDKLKELGIIIPVKNEPNLCDVKTYDQIIRNLDLKAELIHGFIHNDLRPNIDSLIKLANTAKFLNGDNFNVEDGNFYYFFYIENDIFRIDSANINVHDGCILFKTKELAQQALDILGEETIKLALKLN